MNNQKALVVGSTGKLGNEVSRILKLYFELDYCYRVEVKSSNKIKGKVYCCVSKKYFDLSNYKIIINCAWVAGVSHSSLKQNLEICDLLLNTNSNGVFVYFSSIDVYGQNNIETYKCQPRTIFAINKLRVEKFILNITSERAKIILRVGNYISNQQLECDVLNNNFLISLNRYKKSNIVSPAVIVDKIRQFAVSSYKANKTLVENCVNSPNYTWGEILESIKLDLKNSNQKSQVSIQNSTGTIPYFFKCIDRNGNLSVSYSFLKIKVLLILILARFVPKPQKQNNERQSAAISLSRVYQDYTIR